MKGVKKKRERKKKGNDQPLRTDQSLHTKYRLFDQRSQAETSAKALVFGAGKGMIDVLTYWRDYRQNWVRQFAGERASYWHSNAKLLADLQPGDHLWLVTSGASLGHEARQAAFLVAIWKVKDVVGNTGDDPAYPQEDYRFRLLADEEESINFAEPVFVDQILRPHGRDKTVSIGRFLQGPRKLDEQKLRLLRAAAGPDLALKWLTGSKA